MNYLDMATRLALADIEKVRSHRKNFILAAIAIRHDGSLSIATNILTEKPHPRAHAESRVLIKAGYDAKALYICRITRQGVWALAKPCVHCTTLVINKRVKKVIYTVEPGVFQVWKP